MVRIEVKHGESSNSMEFLYECSITSKIDDIAREIVRIANLQSKIHCLASELQPRLVPLYRDPKAMPLLRATSEARSYASKEQVQFNKPLSYYVLRDHVQTVERSLKENHQLLGLSDSDQNIELLTEFLQEDTTQVLWAGKELLRDKRLCDYIGRNEKTKILLRLQ